MPLRDDIDLDVQRDKKMQNLLESIRKRSLDIQSELYFDELTKQQGYKNLSRQTEAAASSRKKFMTKKGERGEEISLTQDVINTANTYLGQGSTSVYTSITYQLEYTRLILEGYAALGYLFKIESAEPKPLLTEELCRWIKEKVHHLKSDRPGVKLPEMNYLIAVDDHGKLEIKLIDHALDKKLDPGEKDTIKPNKLDPTRETAIKQEMAARQNDFNDLVHSWLETKGYKEKIDPTSHQPTSVFVDEKGSVLDAEQWNTLKIDLDKYLHDHSKLNLIDEAVPDTTPRPT